MSTANPSSSLEVSRAFETDPASLFSAWSDPEAIGAWFAPSDEHELTVHEWDFRPQGAYRIEWKHSAGSVHVVGGQFSEIDEPRGLGFTWVWEQEAGVETRVTVTIEEGEKGSLLRLRHVTFPTREESDSHEKGWNGCLDRLARYLA